MVLAARDFEPGMNATSSRVPTAKDGFGCQRFSLAAWLPTFKSWQSQFF
jgi:hypothetical protein